MRAKTLFMWSDSGGPLHTPMQIPTASAFFGAHAKVRVNERQARRGRGIHAEEVHSGKVKAPVDSGGFKRRHQARFFFDRNAERHRRSIPDRPTAPLRSASRVGPVPSPIEVTRPEPVITTRCFARFGRLSGTSHLVISAAALFPPKA